MGLVLGGCVVSVMGGCALVGARWMCRIGVCVGVWVEWVEWVDGVWGGLVGVLVRWEGS
jgi:hypothetical protein